MNKFDLSALCLLMFAAGYLISYIFHSKESH